MENLMDPFSIESLRPCKYAPLLKVASNNFDKAALVEAHYVEAQRSSTEGKRSFYAIYHEETENNEHASADNLLLQPIRLQELQVGIIHKGRVLYGKLCVEPYKAFAVASILVEEEEEEEAGKAVRIRIYNTSSYSAEQACRMFSMGAMVAVKEPYLRKGLDSCLVLHVFDPSYIEVSSPPSSSAAGRSEIHLHWMRGKASMKMGNYCGAILAYTKCIDGLQREGVEKSGIELNLAYSKRAEAFLQCEKYEKALWDANMALGIDSSHEKSIMRRGKALLHLHEYKEAIHCFETISSAQVASELDKAKRMDEENTMGNHYLFENLVYGRHERSLVDLEFGEYVGSVVLRNGRLYAASEIKNGDLIFVTNGIVVMELKYVESEHQGRILDSLIRKHLEELRNKFKNAAKSSRRIVMQLNAIASPTENQDMALFRPNAGWYKSTQLNQEEEVDDALISELVKKCLTTTDYNRFIGLWLVPSMMGHSCTPNCCRFRIGKAMFIHAARDIHAGEELTVSYKTEFTLKPVKSRQAGFKPFMCDCERCSVERRMQHKLRRTIAEYDAANLTAAKMAQLALRLEQILPSCPPIKNQNLHDWLRASFSTAYIEAYFQGKYGSHKLPPIKQVIHAMYSTDPSNPLCLQAAVKIFLADLDTNRQDLGKPLIVEMCKSQFGKQMPEVYRHIITRMVLELS